MRLDEGVSVLDVARKLPAVPVVRDLCRSIAMLEAILSPEWEDRLYSFDAHWSSSEEMASMLNGSGDEYAIVFSPARRVRPGLFPRVPDEPVRLRRTVARRAGRGP